MAIEKQTVFAASYQTAEHNWGKLPWCALCRHTTERTFSATDETHHVITHKPHEEIFICVACWSETKRDEEPDDD